MSQPPPLIPLAIPVEPLDYRVPGPRRPGILTALGIMSILIGALGIIWNLGAIGNEVRTRNSIAAFTSASATLKSLQSMSPKLASQMQSANAAFGMSPRGLPVERRTGVIAAFDRVQPLAPARREMLSQLLADSGSDWFPDDPVAFAAERIVAMISDHGQSPEFEGEPGNDYFIIPAGRIEVSDEFAVLLPPSGKGDPVRVYRQPPGFAAATGFAPPALVLSPLPTRWGAWLPIAENLGSLALAVLLLACGGMVLSNSRRSRRYHLVYSFLKLGLAIAFFAVVGLGIANPMTMLTPQPPEVMVILGVGSLGLSVVYPIAVWIVMSLDSVKWFYEARAARA